LNDRVPEIYFGCGEVFDAPLYIMIIAFLVEVVKAIDTEEVRGIGERPVSPKWAMDGA
jgi:hypothetical protein